MSDRDLDSVVESIVSAGKKGKPTAVKQTQVGLPLGSFAMLFCSSFLALSMREFAFWTKLGQMMP